MQIKFPNSKLQNLLHFPELRLGGVVRDPGTLLLISGAEEALSTLQRLDIEVGDVRLAVSKLDAHLVVGGEHHVVLGQAARTIKDSHDALLHCHLTLVKPP